MMQRIITLELKAQMMKWSKSNRSTNCSKFSGRRCCGGAVNIGVELKENIPSCMHSGLKPVDAWEGIFVCCSFSATCLFRRQNAILEVCSNKKRGRNMDFVKRFNLTPHVEGGARSANCTAMANAPRSDPRMV